MSKSIGIVSFKGGVGKTTSTINLASSLAKMKKRVVVVDANFSSPSLSSYLGLFHPSAKLNDYMNGEREADDIIYKHRAGFDVIPADYSDELHLDKFSELLKELKEYYDYILLDSSPGFNDEMMATLLNADQLFFVSTPDYPTLLSTLKASHVAKRKNLNVSGIILNKIKGKRFELSKSEIEGVIGLPVVVEIVDNEEIAISSSKFCPSVDLFPKSKNSKNFLNLARVISGGVVVEEKRFYQSFFNSLFSAFRRSKNVKRSSYSGVENNAVV